MTPCKLLFEGPDPPCEREQPDPEAAELAAKEAAAAKKKGADEPVAEVAKNPQEELEDKMYEDFVTRVCEQIKQSCTNLANYRYITHPLTGIRKTPLYPKVLSLDQ